jgi:hypothetical protein
MLGDVKYTTKRLENNESLLDVNDEMDGVLILVLE